MFHVLLQSITKDNFAQAKKITSVLALFKDHSASLVEIVKVINSILAVPSTGNILPLVILLNFTENDRKISQTTWQMTGKKMAIRLLW